MSNQISSQVDKLRQILFSATTGTTYKETLNLTWSILKETALLLWLIVCLVLVALDWLGDRAITSGRNARAWFNSLQETSSDQIASETGKSLLLVSKNAADYAVSQARSQLGLPAKPTVFSSTAALPAAPKPVSQPPVKPTPAPKPPEPAIEPVDVAESN